MRWPKAHDWGRHSELARIALLGDCFLPADFRTDEQSSQHRTQESSWVQDTPSRWLQHGANATRSCLEGAQTQVPSCTREAGPDFASEPFRSENTIIHSA